MPPRKTSGEDKPLFSAPRYVPVNVNRLHKAAEDLVMAYHREIHEGAKKKLTERRDPEYFAMAQLLEELSES